jgi:hypothetical protein
MPRCTARGGQVPKSEYQRQPNECRACALTERLIKGSLPTYVLEDPAALSEVLKIRERRRAELEAFRHGMQEVANNIQLGELDADGLCASITNEVGRLHSVFAETRKALADKWRLPKLLLRRSGATVAVGLTAAIGAAAGTLATGGLELEVLKEFVQEIVKEAVKKGAESIGAYSKSTPLHGISAEASLAYLFGAAQDLRKIAPARVVPPHFS